MQCLANSPLRCSPLRNLRNWRRSGFRTLRSAISNLLGISESRWKARHPGVIKRGRARLRKSLRRAQIKSALSGNSTMLVWLGKQYLGQSDRLDHSVSAEHKVISITPNVLERLHTSYRRTMEQLRTRGALPAATEEAPLPSSGRGAFENTKALSCCEDFQLRCA